MQCGKAYSLSRKTFAVAPKTYSLEENALLVGAEALQTWIHEVAGPGNV
jgi:predicted solute-binding protein